MLHCAFAGSNGLPCPAGASDVAIDELNADGRWDLMIGGSEGVSSVLPANNENMADSATNPVIETAGAGSALHRADLDNDGRSDFLVAVQLV